MPGCPSGPRGWPGEPLPLTGGAGSNPAPGATFGNLTEHPSKLCDILSGATISDSSDSEHTTSRTDHINSMQLKFVRELDSWARLKLIRSALERFMVEELAKALGKSKSTIYRYAKVRKQPVWLFYSSRHLGVLSKRRLRLPLLLS